MFALCISLQRTAPALLAAWVFLFVFPSPATATELSPVTDASVDRVVVEKSKRTMTLLKQDREVRTYKIALGRDPVGPKVRQGDNRTPEGIYYVDYKVRNSAYHRALHLSYPNPDDVERARALGVPPGGSIMIHGMKNGSSLDGRRPVPLQLDQRLHRPDKP